jgi:hypothetical protein
VTVRTDEPKDIFDLTDEELDLHLGPLGDLLRSRWGTLGPGARSGIEGNRTWTGGRDGHEESLRASEPDPGAG